MTIQEAAEKLKVKLPISLNALKTAYRRRSHEEHPDVSKHPKASERFQDMKQAYELLQTSSEALEYSAEDAKKLACDDGTPLSELGQGLGPTTNGRPCDECSGKGYRSYKNARVPCTDCRPFYINIFYRAWEYRCRKCSGSGKFKNKGECFACKGRGWHPTKQERNTCKSCRGLSHVDDPKGPINYTKCNTCKGCGEIRIFNPVLPKGLLTGR